MFINANDIIIGEFVKDKMSESMKKGCAYRLSQESDNVTNSDYSRRLLGKFAEFLIDRGTELREFADSGSGSNSKKFAAS